MARSEPTIQTRISRGFGWVIWLLLFGIALHALVKMVIATLQQGRFIFPLAITDTVTIPIEGMGGVVLLFSHLLFVLLFGFGMVEYWKKGRNKELEETH